MTPPLQSTLPEASAHADAPLAPMSDDAVCEGQLEWVPGPAPLPAVVRVAPRSEARGIDEARGRDTPERKLAFAAAGAILVELEV